ncbi:hypothetical protein ACGFY9_19140 [Streptomyces sp. NPDC048504]|uniref:hypothetical protein n=1 Tax=Streptomyces sp. NPDC048504 TaxID=3365559 RepID=UPI00372231BB
MVGVVMGRPVWWLVVRCGGCLFGEVSVRCGDCLSGALIVWLGEVTVRRVR